MLMFLSRSLRISKSLWRICRCKPMLRSRSVQLILGKQQKENIKLFSFRCTILLENKILIGEWILQRQKEKEIETDSCFNAQTLFWIWGFLIFTKTTIDNFSAPEPDCAHKIWLNSSGWYWIEKDRIGYHMMFLSC